VVPLDILERDDREVHLLKKTWPSLNRAYWDDSIAAYDPRNDHVLFAVPTGGDGTLDTIIGYSRRSKSLFLFDGWDPTAMATVESTTGEEYVLVGDVDGYVYKYGDTTWSDGASAIDRIVRSQDFYMGMGAIRKRLHRVDINLRATTSVTGATVATVVDGVEGSARAIGNLTGAGRKKIEWAPNGYGFGVGWKFRLNTVAETVDVLQAASQLTAGHQK
jgi:hypothetical protein